MDFEAIRGSSSKASVQSDTLARFAILLTVLARLASLGTLALVSWRRVLIVPSQSSASPEELQSSQASSYAAPSSAARSRRTAWRSAADTALAQRVEDPGIRAFLLQSLDLKAQPKAWRLNLRGLRDQMDNLVGWPEGLPKASFEGPVLEVAGERSDYVTADGQQALRDHFPQARIVRVKGAGHWLHADAPEAVAQILVSFLGEG